MPAAAAGGSSHPGEGIAAGRSIVALTFWRMLWLGFRGVSGALRCCLGSRIGVNVLCAWPCDLY